MSEEATSLPCGCSFVPEWKGHREDCWYVNRERLELEHRYRSGEIGKPGDILVMACEEDVHNNRRLVTSIDEDGTVWFRYTLLECRTDDKPIRGAKTLAYRLLESVDL